jgi:NADPH-dependent glutamate synthase beta subunit-like oxidoreductase
VLERSEEPGGLLRWGIPAYRLPRPVLKREMARIEGLGVEVRCGVGIDSAGMAALEKEYDAVFVACGQSRSIPLRIEGEAHMRDGLRLLADIRREQAPALSGTVAVIGGGNTAVDVARCLVRLGARPVIVYRRRRRDMPAFAPEVAMAVEEGVGLRTLQAPVKLYRKDGKIAAVFMDMEPVAPGTDGRARVSPVEGSETEMVYDAVVSGVGAEADAVFAAAPESRDLGHCRIAFGAPLRIWGGDLTNPVRSVADAVASGKTAALAIDAFSGAGEEGGARALADCRVGKGSVFSFERYVGGRRSAQRRKIVDFTDLKTDYFPRSGRAAAPVRSPEERAGDFAEVVSGLDSASALEEAQRCFHCGRCDDCDNCRLFCPDMAVAADEGGRRFLLDFCKGCGICVAECPRCALDLAEEP